MTHYHYHVEDESMIKLLDREFNIVVVVGYPGDKGTEGYNLSIRDSRSVKQIQRRIVQLKRTNRKYS